MPGSSRSTPGADSRRGSDSGGDSKSRPRQPSGEGGQTAASSSDGVDATGEKSDDISFEEPEETSRADAGGQQSDGGSGDLSVEAAVDDQVLQEAFEVFDAQGKSPPGQQGDGAADGAGGPQAGSGTSATAGGSATADRIGELNAELDSALGTFDGVILAERDAAKAGDDARADGAANSEQPGDDDGGDFDGGFSIPPAPPGPASGQGQVASEGSENSSGNGTQPARAGDNRKGDYQHASASEAVPADIPDGSDDDVVARQIREAAQRETDPELREKLWDEYRKYKKGK